MISLRPQLDLDIVGAASCIPSVLSLFCASDNSIPLAVICIYTSYVHTDYLHTDYLHLLVYKRHKRHCVDAAGEATTIFTGAGAVVAKRLCVDNFTGKISSFYTHLAQSLIYEAIIHFGMRAVTPGKMYLYPTLLRPCSTARARPHLCPEMNLGQR